MVRYRSRQSTIEYLFYSKKDTLSVYNFSITADIAISHHRQAQIKAATATAAAAPSGTAVINGFGGAPAAPGVCVA